jgi:hypothetical protein
MCVGIEDRVGERTAQDLAMTIPSVTARAGSRWERCSYRNASFARVLEQVISKASPC